MSLSLSSLLTMTSKFKTKEIFLDFSKFKVGLYALDDTTKAPNGSSRIMQNMQITDRGGIAPRPGIELLGTQDTTGSSIMGAYNFKKSFAENEIIMRGNGTKLQIYSKQHPDCNWFTLKDNFTTGKEFGFATSLVNTDSTDYVLFCNRYENYMRWNGAVAQITTALVGAETDITVNSTITSEIFYSSTATSNSATTVTVSSAAWATDQWRNLVIYFPGTGKVRKISANTSTQITFATLGAGPGNVAFQIRKLIFADVTGTIIYNGTEIAYTGIDTATTIQVGSAHAAPDNSGLAEVPVEYPNAPRGNRLTNYLARIAVGNVRSATALDSGGAKQGFASGGSVFVSKIKTPTDFTYSATRVAGEGDIIGMPYGGGEITDVQSQEDTFYTFKEDYIEAIQYSQDANDLAVRVPIKAGVGSKGKTIKGVDDIYFMTKDNKFVSIGRVKTVDQLPQTDNIGYTIKRLLDTYDASDICGAEYKDKIYMSLKSSPDETTNNITVIYNRRLKAFEGIWDIGANAFFEYDGGFYFAESNTANCYKLLTGTADIVGSSRYEISSRYATHFMNLAPRGLTSVQQAVNGLYFEGYIQAGTEINFKLFKDFGSDGVIKFTFNPDTNSQTLDGSISSAFLGSSPMSLRPMGTISFDPDNDGRYHFSFRVYFPFQYGQYYSVGFSSLGADLDYEIIRFGMMVAQDVSWSPDKVIQI